MLALASRPNGRTKGWRWQRVTSTHAGLAPRPNGAAGLARTVPATGHPGCKTEGGKAMQWHSVIAMLALLAGLI